MIGALTPVGRTNNVHHWTSADRIRTYYEVVQLNPVFADLVIFEDTCLFLSVKNYTYEYSKQFVRDMA